MRITLHKTTSISTLASFNHSFGPPWLGGAYYPMGNGYELRVQPLGNKKAMIFTRLIGTKKASPIVVPVVGYHMLVDIEIDEVGKPIWNMHDIIGRLLGEFDLPAVRIHVVPAGTRLELAMWLKRELKYSEGSRYLREIPSCHAGDVPVDAVDGALWAIEARHEHDAEFVNVHVWSDLSQYPDEQQCLWGALQELTAQAA